jgi:carbon-monoxide dehydrogenase medium subunit
VPASEFFVGYFETALAPDEILIDVRVPKYTGWGAHYEKLNRVAQAWSIVAVAAAVQVSNGTIAAARVGLTNVGSGPVRAVDVESALVGQPVSAIAEAALRASTGDGDKDNLARVLTGRALTAAVAG